MSLKLTAEIVELQQRISARLAELGYADSRSIDNLARHLASLAVLGNSFAQSTLPLFLSVDREHHDALAQLATSMKCDLEELGDNVRDVDVDLRALMDFLNHQSRWLPPGPES